MSQNPACFPRCCRLLSAASYKRVFKRPNRSADDFFTILWRSNEQELGRLGIAIAKKNIRRAVDRNLVKRVIRESFRHQHNRLKGIDTVVLSRRGVPLHDKKQLRESLDRLWLHVARSLKTDEVSSIGCGRKK
ncbi:MAG: ribonuclease P protein component [Chromatiaceae bacterium]|nr:ribonuclease P protein component [Gammaproteobacteria bacterium]MCP5428055.1 ribonuclease P protein component [Chromatiaceae bacterium]MCB1863119.1 ribonuclease P protein component [Gammaproteobacteria bacterium]MCB1872832.1 ribonuclease P protein component [Gammaproteobacteria bacterium]MCB1881845.1 ribonuclease P protein component [Gammaproteobacteria bacterium]